MCDARGVARRFESLGETSPDEWYVTLTLTLDDDGRFELRDHRTCYWGSASFRATGRWEQAAGAISLAVEASDHAAWPVGAALAADAVDGDALRLDGTKLYPS
jgi:hypothetical protein